MKGTNKLHNANPFSNTIKYLSTRDFSLMEIKPLSSWEDFEKIIEKLGENL